MKKMKWSFLLLFVLLVFVNSCTTKKKVIDDDFAVDSAEAGLTSEDLTFDDSTGAVNTDIVLDDSTSATAADAALSTDAATDEFSEFDKAENIADNNAQTPPANTAEATDDLDKELDNLSGEAPKSDSVSIVDMAPPVPEIVAETPPSPAPEVVAETPPPVIEASADSFAVTNSTNTNSVASITQITNVQYKGNASGGTVVITADQPITYTTRMNSSTNQIIVEAQNVKVAEKLKRPLNTKDMASSIGNIDIYQKKGSTIARFVIQLRDNSPEPLVQPEGNSLLIVGSPSTSAPSVASNQDVNTQSESATSAAISTEDHTELNAEMSKNGIMGSDDLEAFLTNNSKFYGKKISIEAPDLDIREILKFISEESGVNMIFDDTVKGTASLKLRKVPWDQALVTLLKSKKLSFRRQGNILRIATLDDLIKEDDAAIKLKDSKTTTEALVVKNFAINYADIKDLEAKVKDFIEDKGKDAKNNRGKVTTDARTNVMIVTETTEKLRQVGQLINLLDTQPQQVMIEARIVEASENFSRSVGVNLSGNRSILKTSTDVPPVQSITAGSMITQTPLNPNIQYLAPTIASTAGGLESAALNATLTLGTLGVFGNIDASLALNEANGNVKVLSSPRISVLTNTTATIKQTAIVLQTTGGTLPTPTTAGTVTTKAVDVGVELNVTPFASNIGTVRLKLDINRSALAAGAKGGETTSRSAKTEVIVKSGQTAVIGGVFTTDNISNSSGIPGLKDLPILGSLFRSDVKNTQKAELMIFVTPKIIPALTQVFKADSKPVINEAGELDLK